jgi:large subunit ribosomal protein L27
VGMGRDYTLFAKIEGRVRFKEGHDGRSYVMVVPEPVAAE